MEHQLILTPPRIGQYWQGQGGVLVALMRGLEGQPDYYLIAAAEKSALPRAKKYSIDQADVSGATSDLDGEANTSALVARKGKHPAAIAATKFTADGHTDFYLPSRREARAIACNTPEIMPGTWFWTSTQYSALNAWYQSSDGDQSWLTKTNEGAVVPVRRLSAIE